MNVRGIDIRQFETLYRENYSRMFRVAFDFLQDNEISRDVVSDVFAKIWQKSERMDPATLEGYLFLSVRNQCYNILRDRGFHDKYADYVKHFYDNIEVSMIDQTDERLAQLSRAMEKLPDKTRFVLQQCYFEEHTYREVAEMLDITTDGVKKHVVKAFSVLREFFNVKKKT